MTGATKIADAHGVIYLPDDQLAELGIAPAEFADAIETAIDEQAAGRLHVAPKSAVMPRDGRYMMSTLAVGEAAGLTILKAATVSPDNPDRGLPAINATIIALDSKTGLLRAVMGANWVTAVRTAALSAVAARRLADPGSKVVAFVGCGVQAGSHLDAFAAEFPLKEVRAFGRGAANVEKLCAKARSMGLEANAPDTAEAALSGADLVVSSVTLDYTIAPFLDANWLKLGAFSAITDLGVPWDNDSWGAFGTIVVDDRDQEAAAAKKMVPPEMIRADLGELVSATSEVRYDPARPAAFAFRGMALGDFAAAALALDRAGSITA